MPTTAKKTVADRIRKLSPCGDAKEWASGYTSAAKAWKECPRGDWMLWLIGRTTQSEPWSEERKPIVACALDCAELAKHLWSEKYAARLAEGLAVMRRWIDGTATVEEAKAARSSLWQVRNEAWRDWTDADADAVAVADAAADADADAAAAAAAVADAAAAAAAAAVAAAATAADAAADAAAATATAADARAKTRADCANIVRKHFPKPPLVK